MFPSWMFVLFVILFGIVARKRLSKQQILKRSTAKCFFCGDSNYAVLDVHRIVPGGSYANQANTLVACCKCHRKIHAGQIVMDRKYRWSGPGFIVHYWEDGQEFWRKEHEP